MLSKENVPGPGTYSVKSGVIEKNGPRYSIQARYKSSREIESNPGPGNYKLDH